MSATTRRDPGAPRLADRRPSAPDDPAAPGTVRCEVQIDGVRYTLRREPYDPDLVRHRVSLVARVQGYPSLTLTEYHDPDLGPSDDPAYLGLACSCPDAAEGGLLCRHVRALAACGILRPLPGWDTDGLDDDDVIAAGGGGGHDC